MLNRASRASQFLPFDSLKGLQEELRRREFNNTKETKRDIDEDREKYLSNELLKIEKGSTCEIEYYYKEHYVIKKGTITQVNVPYRFLYLKNSKILFDDIYNIKIID